MRGNETITVIPNTGQDRDGVDTFGEPYDIEGCIPYPRPSDDLEEGGTIIGENVFVPAGAEAVKSSDNVELRGTRYAVDGKPGDFRKSGRRKGILLILKAIQ